MDAVLEVPAKSLPLEQAVEELLEFTYSGPVELSYEARQELRREKYKAVIVALAARKRGES